MPILIYRIGEQKFEVPIKTADITIGRSSQCDICLKHDTEISRFHCSVQPRPDGHYVVMDSASKNGTYVNDHRFFNEEGELNNGDRIRLGHSLITFLDADEERAADAIEELAREMAQGKGFNTIMREIIKKG